MGAHSCPGGSWQAANDANTLPPQHPQAEEAVRAEGFPAVGIFRPGLLDRGAAARAGERLFIRLVSSVPVAGVAAAMLADAEKFLTGAGRPAGVRVFEMASIQKAAAAGAAPE